MIGIVGQLILILSFVTCGMAGIAYFMAVKDASQEIDWRRIGRISWTVMCVGTLVSSVMLSYLIFNHQFQYAYVWQQSSRDLPTHFLLSAFWAGQEGSFMLWIVMMSLMGMALMRWAGFYESAVMAVVSFCQFFLISMIVGLKFGGLDIGSSPFTLIYEKFPQTPVGFIPPDGSGLNDLLQNYWMAIHPPTLFVGFTAMIVPFAFAIAALWMKKYTEWVRPALPWTIFAVMILGIGIAMGGYWAYETLSFGGYWAWDPVENSSLVPWIIGVAALHMMIVQKKSGASHKSALFLCILGFILVVYSTFLTRSGILGDVSVHSFVDLGLYNQLLIWILSMALLGFGLFTMRYNELPKPTKEPRVLSREFMIFTGALILCGIAVVVILGTSAPILGRIFRDNPSAVPISFYNAWTVPLSIAFIFLAGLGQLFWWNKMSLENVNRVLLKPIALSFVSTIIVLVFTPFVEQTSTALAQEPSLQFVNKAGLFSGLDSFWSVYGGGVLLLFLVFVTFFALYGNGMVLWKIGRGNIRLAGGAISHIGFMIMVLGIIASSSFSNALSGNFQGEQRGNFVLSLGETRQIEDYTVTYRGKDYNGEGRPLYIVDFEDNRGRAFTMKPVVYKSNKDQWIQNPDIKQYFEKDIFVAVSPNVMLEDEPQASSDGASFTLSRGDSIALNDGEYQLRFVNFEVENLESEMIPDTAAIAVAALLNLKNNRTNEVRGVSPIYLVMEDGSQQFIQNRVADWGLTVTFAGMNVDTGSANFIIEGAKAASEDWVVVQAYEKPFINLVWIGIIVLSGGFVLSMSRRIGDHRQAMARKKPNGKNA